MHLRRPAALTALALAGVAVVVAGPAGAAGTKTVAVKDDLFAPKSLTVSKGTKVRWTWQGEAPHNVVVDGGPQRFSSKTQTSGSYTRTLTRKGTYRIVCTLHEDEGMRMTLRVR
ncbi:plastocyanin/azurin family copper-binding protein [Conexibacter sp. SYSU D00693]|uniref:cupredoxin domain-containing protein n=1 Tax=Conexibacter sp. SYSU D00693 TaxID=2812560 RepID=UPI00196AC542|nr:plastocyanin/azurin family copper-binding protein [Conexibacter sp. SYSU D00693]